MTLNGRLRKSGAPETTESPSSVLSSIKFRKIDQTKQVGDEIIAGYQLIEAAWKKAEAKLALAHVPVDVKIKIGSGSIGDDEHYFGDYRTYLGYVKVKNQWRICHIREETIYQGPEPVDEYDVRPITECPVQERLDMFDWFPKLHEEVIKVTKEFVPVIKDKVANFEKLLDSVEL